MRALDYRDENIIVPELGKKTRIWIRSDGVGVRGCIQLIPVQRTPNGAVEMQLRPPTGTAAVPAPMPR